MISYNDEVELLLKNQYESGIYQGKLQREKRKYDPMYIMNIIFLKVSENCTEFKCLIKMTYFKHSSIYVYINLKKKY